MNHREQDRARTVNHRATQSGWRWIKPALKTEEETRDVCLPHFCFCSLILVSRIRKGFGLLVIPVWAPGSQSQLSSQFPGNRSLASLLAAWTYPHHIGSFYVQGGYIFDSWLLSLCYTWTDFPGSWTAWYSYSLVSVRFKHFKSHLLPEGKQYVLWFESATMIVFRTSMRLPGSDTVTTYTAWSKVQRSFPFWHITRSRSWCRMCKELEIRGSPKDQREIRWRGWRK